MFADVDPESRGMDLTIWDSPSHDHRQITRIEPGRYAGAGTMGWTHLSPRKWLYRDKTATPAWKKTTIADRATPDRPGWVTVKAKGTSSALYPVAPFHFAVTLGTFAVDGTAGRCGETIVNESNCPARPVWYHRCSR